MGRNALQGWHIVVLVVVILLLFGAKRLPDLAKSVGQSMKIFKREMKDLTTDAPAPVPPASPSTAPAAPPVTQAEPPVGQPPVQPHVAPEPSAPAPQDRPGESGPSTSA
ncbi:Sec-independent protein translocase subunit TatA [Cellulomonas sp. CW35]|uniref:Sec-independent protein translocase subunit TatA n=1 Tax=Cellulomonas sp. CW35 TaxID=3458249 RepID=UPI0040334945